MMAKSYRTPISEVVGIVAGCYFERPGAEFSVHVVIGDDRDFTIEDRHERFRPINSTYRSSSGCTPTAVCAQDGFRRVVATGQHAAALDWIVEVVEETGLFAVLHLQITHGCLQSLATSSPGAHRDRSDPCDTCARTLPAPHR